MAFTTSAWLIEGRLRRRSERRSQVVASPVRLATVPKERWRNGQGGWEARETPGTFTLHAHLAFFHGFLPTPPTQGPHPRLFALEFDGSLSTAATTFVFRGVDNVIAGFHGLGYRSFCVGGVGFFNKKNPLGHVLPGFFQQSVWSPALGVTAKDSTAAAC